MYPDELLRPGCVISWARERWRTMKCWGEPCRERVSLYGAQLEASNLARPNFNIYHLCDRIGKTSWLHDTYGSVNLLLVRRALNFHGLLSRSMMRATILWPMTFWASSLKLPSTHYEGKEEGGRQKQEPAPACFHSLQLWMLRPASSIDGGNVTTSTYILP
jgi:hypothetical protein